MSNNTRSVSVRMDANSPEANWWLKQSDREFSMQCIIDLAQQYYGKNADLKMIAIKQMRLANQNHVNKQVTLPNTKNIAKEDDRQTHQIIPDKLNHATHREYSTDLNHKEKEEIKKPTAPINQQDNDINTALFGSENKDTSQAKKRNPRDFRDFM